MSRLLRRRGSERALGQQISVFCYTGTLRFLLNRYLPFVFCQTGFYHLFSARQVLTLRFLLHRYSSFSARQVHTLGFLSYLYPSTPEILRFHPIPPFIFLYSPLQLFLAPGRQSHPSALLLTMRISITPGIALLVRLDMYFCWTLDTSVPG